MSCEQARSVARRLITTVGAAVGFALLLTGCGDRLAVTPEASTTLRIGVGGLPQQTQQAGLRQLVATLSLEALVAPSEDGRPRPSLAESFTTAPDGLSLTVQLPGSATFHDGTPLTSALVADALRKSLPGAMGVAFDDVERILPVGAHQVRVDLRRRSQFVAEALETLIQKPDARGPIGTGPYVASTITTPAELHAYGKYYRGPAAIQSVSITPYASLRAAWAELLRGNVDMLYEVNMDALDSLESASSVAIFSSVRHYQYMIIFGPRNPKFQAPEIRRELNAAIDRDAIVRNALNGHGIPSTGPLLPQHWALDASTPRPVFDRELALKLSARHLEFTCLVPADSVYERMALEVKRQLAATGVDMHVREGTQEQILDSLRKEDYEAVLGDPIGGPTVFRAFRMFHSGVSFAPKPRVTPAIDAALDQVRHAATDSEYRAGVKAFQEATLDDPPALFLAWGERARAVSKRFDVVVPEAGRDIINSIRLWHPANADQIASRN